MIFSPQELQCRTRYKGRVQKRFGKRDERKTATTAAEVAAAAWKETVQSIIHGEFGVKRPLKRLKKMRERRKKTIPVFRPNFNLFSRATVVSCPRPVYTPHVDSLRSNIYDANAVL